MTSTGSKNNIIYTLKSIINDATFYTNDLKNTTDIDGVTFYIVKDEKGRRLMVKKDSVKITSTKL
jgi:hypothetical protein